MKYNSVDEIDTISFRDAAIVRCVFSAKQGILEFELDGAMVRENNSANELFSDRYVRDMQVRFVNPEVEADRKSTRLNSSHMPKSRMPSSA